MLGVTVFSAGQSPDKEVDIHVSGNRIRNITEPAINFRRVGGDRKFEEGYVGSALEQRGLLYFGVKVLLGLLAGGGKPRDEGRPVSSPKITGFGTLPAFSDSQIRIHLNRLPRAHLRRIREIIYVPTRFAIQRNGKEVAALRGSFSPAAKVISIYEQSPQYT